MSEHDATATSTAQAVGEAEPLPRRLGPCHLNKLIGEGAMGRVYLAELAEDREYGRAGKRVAVKLLRADRVDATGNARERFLREAQVGMRIVHPAVVRTFAVALGDAVAPGGGPYLILEHVAGRTLRQLMQELVVVPEALLRQLAVQIARGLEAIHAAHAVHRDLKPSNVMITPDYGVKLMDFGVAYSLAAEEASITSTGFFVGTPAYAAPEQFDGGEVGPPADLYALGVLLHEAASGKHPFTGASVRIVAERHRRHAPTKLGELNTQVSPLFEELVAQLLAKDPAQRFVSAMEVVTILEEGEASAWWQEREARLRALHPHGDLRRPHAPAATAFVGRDEEIGLCRALYAEACAGRGHLLLVEGEPGIGKSRLVEEFLAALGAEDRRVLVLRGANPPGYSSTGAGALGEALVRHLGASTLTRKLEGYLQATPRLVPGLAAFLTGVPPTGAEALGPDALHAAFCLLTRALADKRPVVWLVEDLQFASAESRALLISLARIAADLSLLVVATSRPGLAAEELAHLERLPHTRRLALARLSAREVVKLVRDVVGRDAVADQVAGIVAYKSDGNPFFALEMLRGLREMGLLDRFAQGLATAESDLGSLGVPSSVRELLRARIDEVSDEEHALLDVAAVQGFLVDPDLVARVLGRPRLGVLQALAVLERRSGLIRATGSGFHFDHHQLQEVIYEALPPLLRAEYHALIAEAFAERERLATRLPAEAPGEAAVFLARHYLSAGRGEDGRRWLLRALGHLESVHRHEALLSLAELALRPPAEDRPGLLAEVRLRQAAALDFLGRRTAQRAALEDALRLAEAAGDGVLGLRGRLALGWLLSSIADYAAAAPVLSGAVDEARAIGRVEDEARAQGMLGVIDTELSRHDEARSRLGRSLALACACGSLQVEAYALGNLGLLALAEGHLEEARSRFEQQVALARRVGDRRSEARAIGNLAAALSQLGRAQESIEKGEAYEALCREIGYRRGEAIAAGRLGASWFHLGRLDRARESFERHLAMARAIGDRMGEAIALTNLGSEALEEGRLDAADGHLAAAVELARSLGTRAVEAEAHCAQGELYRARGRHEDARRRFEEAVALQRAVGVPKLLARPLLALGRFLVERGESEQARALLAEACGLAPSEAMDELGPLPACYLALLDRSAAAVEASAVAPVAVRAETQFVLHRLTGDRKHLDEARRLVADMAKGLTTAGRERFARHSPLGRLLASAKA